MNKDENLDLLWTLEWLLIWNRVKNLKRQKIFSSKLKVNPVLFFVFLLYSLYIRNACSGWFLCDRLVFLDFSGFVSEGKLFFFLFIWIQISFWSQHARKDADRLNIMTLTEGFLIPKSFLKPSMSFLVHQVFTNWVCVTVFGLCVIKSHRIKQHFSANSVLLTIITDSYQHRLLVS